MIAVAFHVPFVYNDGEPIPSYYVNQLMQDVISMNGGVTTIPCWGAWVHDGDFYHEPMLRVLVGVEEQDVESFVQLIDARLKDEFRQFAVWIEVDGKPSIR